MGAGGKDRSLHIQWSRGGDTRNGTELANRALFALLHTQSPLKHPDINRWRQRVWPRSWGLSMRWALWEGLEAQQLPSIDCVYKTDITLRSYAES